MHIVYIHTYTYTEREREDEQNIKGFLMLQKELLAMYYIFINIHNFLNMYYI